ncbi:asparagine synthase (glutamine-hydrolyzing) [Elusimicrobiota bacterium]
MCGILGLRNLDSQPADIRLLRAMSEVLKHRGPDDAGVHVDGSVGLGIRRLAVIDLVTGHQPIHNENSRVWAVQNGEIYNFQTLRSTLEQKGHRFYTKTDTEVIVHLYEEFGEDFVRHLNGMFAIALWDAASRRLIVARDRCGIKPLFYYLDSERLIFASEVKAILQSPAVKRKANMKALPHYLTYGYVPAPMTMFEGIKKLPPAHVLIAEGDRIVVKPYWDLAYSSESIQDDSYWLDALHRSLKQSVSRQLVSDVPLGVFLSGGIDSSLLVCMASGLMDRPVKTFSIGFDDPSHNELPFARAVSKQFQTEHHEFVVKPAAAEILPELIWHFDEPFADSSAIPTYYLSKLAREHVTVVLSGEGGDELFAGYDRYRRERLTRIFSLAPEAVRTLMVEQLLKRLPRTPAIRGYSDALKKIIGNTFLSPARRYASLVELVSPEVRTSLLSDHLRHELEQVDPVDMIQSCFMSRPSENWVNRMSRADTTVYLPDDLLVKSDRMSMAHSLEARVPFLDNELIELATSIPANLKLRRGTAKYLPRKLLSSLVPKEIAKRGKRGFNVPIDLWLRTELSDFARDTLLSKRARERGFFQPKTVEAKLQEHQSGKSDLGGMIWALICFELWHQMFMDSEGPDCGRFGRTELGSSK